MKKHLAALLLLLTYNIVLFAQDKGDIQRPSLGVHLLRDHFNFKKDLVSPDRYDNNRLGIALNYLRGYTPRTDLDITLAGSFLALPEKSPSNDGRQLFLELAASLREKLFPGAHRLNPFLQAGVGLSRFDHYYGAFLPAGLGLQANLPGEAFLILQGQYRIPLTDNQAGHTYFSIGIAGIIGKKKKRPPAPVASRAAIASPVKDTDGDGIPDSSDACPFQAGSASFNGCPDTDGDGIPDKKDKCPLVKGIARLQGCPAPDRDNDGIADESDKCPDLPGIPNNAGCPLVDTGLLQRIEIAAKNIFFETDKYVLLPASFPSLDEVAHILHQHPFLRLDITGHTDSTGTPEKNRTLSLHRANAVLDYLAAKPGVDKQKLTAAGYGSDRPIADNNTTEGRALNRRVALTLRYY